MKKPVDVYLSGGMRREWQDAVKSALVDLTIGGWVRFSDPRDNNTKDPAEYLPLDKIRFENADIVFGYAEDENPGLYGLCVEMTAGKYSGATTLLVNGLDKKRDAARYRYFSFIRVVTDYETDDLGKGIGMLRKMIFAYSH